jgi:hypothetical protein
MRAIASGVARFSIIRRTGSPGTTFIRIKVTKETPHKTTIVWARGLKI